MIELYTWDTPNGRKISIMLEECGLPYNVHKVDLRKGEQFTPDFVTLNPNSKIPVIVDSDGPRDENAGKPITLMESGGIAGGRRQRALGLRKDDKEAAP